MAALLKLMTLLDISPSKCISSLNKSELSRKVAKDFWPNNSKAYRAKYIVRWSKEYFEQGELSKHCLGARIKILPKKKKSVSNLFASRTKKKRINKCFFLLEVYN
jgi:hypothetical protein